MWGDRFFMHAIGLGTIDNAIEAKVRQWKARGLDSEFSPLTHETRTSSSHQPRVRVNYLHF